MYTPNNVSVYLKAFAGFLSGITAAAITDTAPADFTAYAQQSDAYAQQFDTSWGVGAVTILELSIIEEASEAVWENRSQLVESPLIPGSYTQTVESVIARVVQGNAQVVSEGIDPNGGGTPGTGTVTSVSATAPIRITGSPAVAPNVTFQPGWTPELFLANLTSLTSFNVTAPTPLVQGNQAGVQTNGSVWSYRSAATLTDDGITVVSATGGGQWVRENVSLYLPIYLLQTAWFVDAQNVSGTASDENDGLTSATALINKKEIFRRWGFTWTPNLVGPLNVVITYLSTDVGGANAGTDSGLFAPNFINGATLLETAALPAAAFTGTLLAVTAKSVAGNQALTSTFTPATGAVAAKMLLVNTTRGNSRCWAILNLGAGVWLLSQPLAPYAANTVPAPTNVDTWANGDSIQGFVPLAIDLAVIGGKPAAYTSTFQPAHVVQNLNIVDSSAVDGGQAALTIDGNSYPLLVDCIVSRRSTFRAGELATAVFQGVAFPSGSPFFGTASFGVGFAGGYFQSGANLAGIQFSNFTMFLGAGNLLQGGLGAGSPADLNDSVYVHTAGALQLAGRFVMQASGIICGPGTLNVKGGALIYTATAVASLPVATLQATGLSTAYGNLTAAGATTVFNRALTAAALDAASGLGTGFAGYAYGGGSSYSRAGAQP